MEGSLLLTFLLICLSIVKVVPSRDWASVKNTLSGVHLRLPAAINPPVLFMRENPKGNVSYDGIDKQLADWLTSSLNITYSYVPLNQSRVKTQGPTQTMIEMLLNQTIDVIATPTPPSLARKQFMEFSYPYVIGTYKISSPWPKEKNRFSATIRPFETTVWLLLGFSFAIVALSLSLITFYQSRTQLRTGSLIEYFGRYFMYILNNALGQDDYVPFRGSSIRLALSGWCLITVVIMNTYTSRLVSYMTLPVYEKTINSFEDLAARPEFPLTILADSVFLQTLMDARAGPYKTIADSIRKHPEYLTKSIPEAMEKMFSGKHCLVNVAPYIEILIARDLKERKTCRLTISKPLPISDFLTYGLPKHGPYNEIINQRFIYLWETGLILGWALPYRGNYEGCIVRPVRPRMVGLKLSDFYGAFMLLAIGTGLALMAFIYERMQVAVHNINRKKNEVQVWQSTIS